LAAAVALLSEYTPDRRADVQSFISNREQERLRLTPGEIDDLRFIFCELSGEAGYGGSSSAAQLERLAASPHLLDGDWGEVKRSREALRIAIAAEEPVTWKRHWLFDRATSEFMSVHSASHCRAGLMAPVERYCDRSLEPIDGRVVHTEFGASNHRCWRALRDLSVRAHKQVSVLYGLYGDRPPGLLDLELWKAPQWNRSVNREYLRLVRFVEEGGPTALDLEHRLRVDKRRREGEQDDNYKTRLAAAQSQRTALLLRLAGRCEKLIEEATLAYRDAWARVG
jgi:hypothetical protein